MGRKKPTLGGRDEVISERSSWGENGLINPDGSRVQIALATAHCQRGSNVFMGRCLWMCDRFFSLGGPLPGYLSPITGMIRIRLQDVMPSQGSRSRLFPLTFAPSLSFTLIQVHSST